MLLQSYNVSHWLGANLESTLSMDRQKGGRMDMVKEIWPSSTLMNEWYNDSNGHTELTPKHRETHGCVVSTVATDALVLKHQAISIHNAD